MVHFDLLSADSGNLLAENFNPIWFLLEAHRYTSFFDLKLGLQRLKREVEQSDQAPVQFMRDNLDIFLQSYDTLSDILTHTCTHEYNIIMYTYIHIYILAHTLTHTCTMYMPTCAYTCKSCILMLCCLDLHSCTCE